MAAEVQHTGTRRPCSLVQWRQCVEDTPAANEAVVRSTALRVILTVTSISAFLCLCHHQRSHSGCSPRLCDHRGTHVPLQRRERHQPTQARAPSRGRCFPAFARQDVCSTGRSSEPLVSEGRAWQEGASEKACPCVRLHSSPLAHLCHTLGYS